MRPVTCATTVRLPAGLVAAALGMATSTRIEPADVQDPATCYLQSLHRGPHHGLVLDLDRRDGAAVWAVWMPREEPFLVVLDACAVQARAGMDVCTEAAGHTGLHSWELRDPLMEVARAALARIPLAGP